MDANGEIMFSSFLAGALLKEKSITFIELTNYMGTFEEDTNYSIFDDGFNRLNDIIIHSDMVISLSKNYDDIYNNVTVRDYLYSLTCKEVRQFFNIEEASIIQNTDLDIKKNGIFKKIRTRVFHIL